MPELVELILGNMKKIFYILFILYTTLVSGATYYVATTGNDGNAGTIASPWLTWHYAFGQAEAGDTVYFRGGVYPMSITTGGGEWIDPRSWGNDGTRTNPICFFNYPSEVPVLDGSNITTCPYNVNKGIEIAYSDFMHFKGLIIRDVRDFDDTDICSGILVRNSNNIILENITVINIGGTGILVDASDTIHIINCDVTASCDSFGTIYSQPYIGGNGDGFQLTNFTNRTGAYYLKGCRSFRNSDDGFGSRSQSYIEYDSCWSIDNGYADGDGNGYKYGQADSVSLPLQRLLRNCMAMLNNNTGFTENNYMYRSLNMHIYNNISYGNKIGYGNFGDRMDELHGNWYRNNVSYNDTTSVLMYGDYEHEYNSWDASPSVSVTSGDFISVDTTGMTGARQSDGSLPEINFGKLAQGSDLINAGVDVGLPFNGGAPDMGWFESAYEAPEPQLGSRNVILRQPSNKQVIIRSAGTKQIIIR